ncbi:M24 family metallopeptidase [candidate division CSSED10-310 bacterium]|uniref:M24 family metallopeptidase n=1 Tax=candidate division CSSED10-310 bacterium TaxID=2855610 RepID=A0ABV6YRJ2_UNCC1
MVFTGEAVISPPKNIFVGISLNSINIDTEETEIMKQDIINIMNKKNIDFILLSGTRSSNPAINYLVPEIHMFKIFLVLRKNDIPVILYNDLERDEAEATGYYMLNYNELFDYGYQPRLEDSVARSTSFYRSIFNALNIQGKVSFNIVDDVSFLYLVLQQLQEQCQNIEFDLKNGANIFDYARTTKDAEEIEAIRQAGLKTCQVFKATEDYLERCFDKNGSVVDAHGQEVTIRKIKQFIEIESAQRGLILGMDTIFSQGRDAGVPHNTGNPEEGLKTGKSIVFDYFPHDKASGYKFDMTRSYCLNQIPPHLKQAYHDIKTALDIVAQKMTLGEKLQTYHNLVCDHFENQGYPTTRSNPKSTSGFTHGLGHGIGLEVHELPSVGPLCEETLKPGQVFTLEPGLYFPEKGWGLRLEDIVAVTHDDQIENLTPHPKKFQLTLKPWT